MPRAIPPERFHELLAAATEVFLERGYRRTQMADVAARLGVAKGTLYLYVESKQALFDAVLRHADAEAPVELPARLPARTPARGATLRLIRRRVAEAASLPILRTALARRRVADADRELEAVVRELYALLARHRSAIRLLDRTAQDHPQLAAVWYGAGRGGLLALLGHYLGERMRRRLVRPLAPPALLARIVLETVVTWAVHRHADPAPQAIDDASAEEAVVRFVVGALRPR